MDKSVALSKKLKELEKDQQEKCDLICSMSTEYNYKCDQLKKANDVLNELLDGE